MAAEKIEVYHIFFNFLGRYVDMVLELEFKITDTESYKRVKHFLSAEFDDCIAEDIQIQSLSHLDTRYLNRRAEIRSLDNE